MRNLHGPNINCPLKSSAVSECVSVCVCTLLCGLACRVHVWHNGRRCVVSLCSPGFASLLRTVSHFVECVTCAALCTRRVCVCPRCARSEFVCVCALTANQPAMSQCVIASLAIRRHAPGMRTLMENVPNSRTLAVCAVARARPTRSMFPQACLWLRS